MSTLQESTAKPAAKGVQPTRVRWKVAALLGLITALTYIDRLNLGIAIEYIQQEFAFSTQTAGWILSAFVWSYAVFQVPAGWLGDRYGPRSVLTFAILWWSVFTAATAAAPRLPFARWVGMAWSFASVRFLIGAGESATLPNANKIVAYWMGEARRAAGNSIFLAGLGVGGTLTPVLITWTMQRWGWRTSFYTCAAMGLIVATAWHLYATNRPEEHRRVNAAELEIIRASQRTGARAILAPNHPRRRPPWKRMLRSRSVWALTLSYACEGYPNYIFYTWFFKYLVSARGLSMAQGSVGGAAPFLAIALMAPLGGWASDSFVKRFGKRRGRQAAVWIGMTCSAGLLSAGAHAANNILAVLLLAFGAGFNIFATATWWGTCIDLTRNFSGSLSALMNTFGNLGGAISPVLTALIATRLGWPRALDFAALVTLASCFVWCFVNAEEDLDVLHSFEGP